MIPFNNRHPANKSTDELESSARSSAGSRRALVPIRRPGLLVAVLVGNGVLLAACGGGSSSTTTQIGATASMSNRALALVTCLRAHGESNLADPTNQGGHETLAIPRSISSSPQFDAAWSRCKHLALKNGGSSFRPTITRDDQVDYLKAAACMRSHGFSDFPDPVFGNNAIGGVKINIPPNIDEASPQFKSAVSTCDKLIPTGLPYSRPSAS